MECLGDLITEPRRHSAARDLVTYRRNMQIHQQAVPSGVCSEQGVIQSGDLVIQPHHHLATMRSSDRVMECWGDPLTRSHHHGVTPSHHHTVIPRPHRRAISSPHSLIT